MIPSYLPGLIPADDGDEAIKITFKPYARRDGSLMLYINRSNKVSVGLSERGFSPYGKGVTQGERNAMQAAFEVFRANAVPFTGDLAQHKEIGFCASARCDAFTLVGTDVGDIGGMKVDADGPYIVYDNLILRCGTYDEINS